MVEYTKVNVKLSDRQLKQLETGVKKKTGKTLRMSLNFLMEMICPMKYCWYKIKNQAKKYI